MALTRLDNIKRIIYAPVSNFPAFQTHRKPQPWEKITLRIHYGVYSIGFDLMLLAMTMK